MEPHTGGGWDRANVQCGPGGHARNAGDRAHQPTDQGAIRRGDKFPDITDPYLLTLTMVWCWIFLILFIFIFIFYPSFFSLHFPLLFWLSLSSLVRTRVGGCSGHTYTLTYISTLVDWLDWLTMRTPMRLTEGFSFSFLLLIPGVLSFALFSIY